MAHRTRSTHPNKSKNEPLDGKVFRYLITTENGKCSLSKLLQTFIHFKTEDGIIDWVENLQNRKLLEVQITWDETLIKVDLNGAQVCKKYGYGGNCTNKCNKIHVCLYHLKGFCYKKEKCVKSHNIQDEHNTKVLKNHDLSDLDYRGVFKALRYIFRWNKSKAAAADSTDDVQSQVSELESLLDDMDAQSVVSEGESLTLFDDMDEDDVDEVELFRRILTKYGGQCEVTRLIDENPDLGTEDELNDLFDDIGDNESDESEWFQIDGEFVSLHLSGMEICCRYTRRPPCKDENCPKLHLCKFGVLGSCRHGAKCKFYHRLKSGPNVSKVQALEEDGLAEDDILQYLKIQLQKNNEGSDDDRSTSSEISTVGTTSPRVVRSELVHYILRVHNGKCKYGDIIGMKEKFGFKNKQQIRNYIKDGDGKECFNIYQGLGGDLVCVALGKIEICSAYKKKTSCQKDCGKLHLCAFGVKGKCAFKRCKFYHDLDNTHNRDVIQELILDDLEADDILFYLKLQFQDDEDEDAATGGSGGHQEVKRKDDVDCGTGKAKIAEQTNIKPQATLPHHLSDTSDMNLNRQREVLRCLVRSPDGCCSLAELHQNVKEKFTDTTDLQGWLTSQEGQKFCVVQRAVTPQETLVMLYVPVFQICFNYYSDEGCQDPGCTFIHLCQEFVTGVCRRNTECRYSHNTRSQHNGSVIRKAELTFESSDDIMVAIRHSTPVICQSHNSSNGCQNTACRKFHICANYLQFQCQASVCRKGHDLKGSHNSKLIKTLGLLDKLVFKTLQVTCPAKEMKPRSNQSGRTMVEPIPNIDKVIALRRLTDGDEEEILVEKISTIHEFTQYTSKQILNWLTGPEGKEICRVHPANTPGKHLVRPSVKSLQMCFGYYGKKGCQKENKCRYLHLCREYIAGVCQRRNCKYSHNVRDEHNNEVLQRARLSFACYQDDDIKGLVTRSTPQVCLDHNSQNRCRNLTCMKFHICADKIRHKCNNSDETCPKGHSLQTEHNRQLLDIYDTPENVMYMMLIVASGEISKQKKIHTVNASEKVSTKEESAHVRILCSGSVLEKMLRKYQGYCTFKQLRELCPPDLNPPTLVILLEEPTVQKYYSTLTTERGNMVLAKVKDLDLCYHYYRTEGCSKANCLFLHMCREYLAGHCRMGARCKFSHNIEDRQNSRVLSEAKIPRGISEDLLLKLIQNSIPCVCKSHNTGSGCRDELCHKFHVCNNYVKRSCTRSTEECTFGHSFETRHNLKLVELYNCTLDNVKGRVAAADQLKNHLIEEIPMGTKSKRQGFPGAPVPLLDVKFPQAHDHINTEEKLHLTDVKKAPSIPICHNFVNKSCRSRQCTMHHYTMPYLWCIMENGAWKPFDSRVSQWIEELYSKPEENSYIVSTYQ